MPAVWQTESADPLDAAVAEHPAGEPEDSKKRMAVRSEMRAFIVTRHCAYRRIGKSSNQP
jgi:hypothetical protein